MDNSIQKCESVITSDEIYDLCIEKFISLPRTGKPTEDQWTVLSCIVEYNSQTKKAKVVSLGTGTKCIGSDEMCPKGFILNDSHAEIMARRGFLRYMYANMMDPAKNNILIYDNDINKFRINDYISYHFFSTHAPCGDATIDLNSARKDGDNEEPEHKKVKLSPVTVDGFTGGKLLKADENTDLMSQDEGAIRTKPGRGVRTLSVSCSDKLSRWNVIGIQGALIDMMLDKPVYLKTFTFAGQVCENSIKRALYERWSERTFKNNRYSVQKPQIRVCAADRKFEYEQTNEKDPSPSSIVWSDVSDRALEVAVSGKRQGVTKSKRDTPAGSLRISKYWLWRDFFSTISSKSSLLDNFNMSVIDIKNSEYGQVKFFSNDYQSAWQVLKDEYFQSWTKKPDSLLKFKVELRS